MKKIIVSTIVLIICNIVNAQIRDTIIMSLNDSLIQKRSTSLFSSFNGASNIKIPEIIYPTPQTQIYEKYINQKISEVTGIPEISIPLGEIQLKGLTIPIQLNYHASGVKQHQFDGDVGAGWTINVGGYRIARTIYGKSDFDYSYYSDSQFKEVELAHYNERQFNKFDPSRELYDHNPLYEYNELLERIGNSYFDRSPIRFSNDKEDYLDGELDQFSFNTPTSNGHFIGMFSNNNSETECSVIERTDEKIRMSRNSGKIFDNLGNEYSFGSSDGKERIEYSYNDKIQRQEEVGWMLKQIKTPYGEDVTFKYQTFPEYSQRANDTHGIQAIYPIFTASMEPEISWFLYGIDIYSQFKIKPLTQKIYCGIKSHYVEEIKTNDMTIKFYRRGAEYFNSNNNHATIDHIIITDSRGNFIKKIMFTYENTDTSRSHHKLLTSVKIVDSTNEIGDTFRFDYYPGISTSTAIADQWGYYLLTRRSSYQGVALHTEFVSDSFVQYFSNNAALPLLGRLYDIAGSAQNCFVDRKSGNSNAQSYTLKRISYPTGEYTEYKYESNQYVSQEGRKVYGGGIRIKNIKSYAMADATPISSEYTYSVGIPNFDVDERNFTNYDIGFGVSRQKGECGMRFGDCVTYFNALDFHRTIRYSTTPTGDVPIGKFQVNYPEVTTVATTINKNGQSLNLGKSVSKYLIPKQYETDMILNSESELPISLNGLQEDIPSRAGVYVKKYMLGYKPQLLSKSLYDNDNKIVSQNIFTYKDYFETSNTNPKFPNTNALRGVKVKKRITFSDHFHARKEEYDTKMHITDYAKNTIYYYYYDDTGTKIMHIFNYVNSFFSYMYYEIKCGRLLPATKQTITYDKNGNKIEVMDTYTYDKYGTQLINTTTSNSQSGQLEKRITYLNDANLKLRNITSLVEETVTLNNNKEIGRIKTEYPKGSILPSKVLTSASGSLLSAITYDKYDSNGNILQYTLSNNIPISYLWSYGKKYPIAEFKNATYTQIVSILGQDFINKVSAALIPANEDLNKINLLRSNCNYSANRPL